MKTAIPLLSISAFLLVGCQNKPIEKQPTEGAKIFLSVYETTQTPMKNLCTTTISRSAKNLDLCWVVEGDFPKNVQVVETFKSSEPQIMTVSGDTKVLTFDGGKINVVKHSLENLHNGKTIVGCWSFDKSDPVGKQTLQVEVDNTVYPIVSFDVVE